MNYQIACSCHKIHQVTTGDAGSSLKCSCGQNVEVPSLTVLRREAGELGGSPELMLETMLRDGELPQDSNCVKCHAKTDNVRYFSVECETPEIKESRTGVGHMMAFVMFFGWLGALMGYLRERGNMERENIRGRLVNFRLPLQICEICDRQRRPADSMELLRQSVNYCLVHSSASIGRRKCAHGSISCLNRDCERRQ